MKRAAAKGARIHATPRGRPAKGARSSALLRRFTYYAFASVALAIVLAGTGRWRNDYPARDWMAVSARV